jgi:hypothetical protein
LERHFGWIGLVIALVGSILGIVSLVLAIEGWSIERLWFYLLAAAMSLIVGVQLTVFWIIMRMLGELNQRQAQIAADLRGKECETS